MQTATLDLVLVRHGVTDWNEDGRLMGRSDIALNARGTAQARAVAEALRELQLGAVLASPQRRAQETAAVITRAQGLKVETEPDLAEVWLGRWQGKTFDDLRGDPDLERYFADPTYHCDAIEPADAIERRVVATVQRLEATATYGRVALVSHGDPLRIIVAHYMGMGLAGFRQLSIDPASVSILRLSGGHHQLLALNWQPAGLLPALTS